MANSSEHFGTALAATCWLSLAACSSGDPKLALGVQAGASPAAAVTAGRTAADKPQQAAAVSGNEPSAASASSGGKAGSVGDATSGSHTAAGSGGGTTSPAAAGARSAAGSGGMTGTAGAAAGGGAELNTPYKPKCKANPKQVIVIGDSYINWITHTFTEDIVREAGETWRMYAVGGCSLGSGGLCLIPDQLDQALMEDKDIIAALMTGGGNDILITDEMMFPGGADCKDRTDSPTLKVCQDIVATAIAAGDKLMQKAADAGIRDVIYMFYPHTPGGGFGGAHPTAMLDYAQPKAKVLCDEAAKRTQGKLHCHFIDLVPIFEGHADWFADDGIHENSLGSAAMAKEVVRVAKEKCIAQPASSGCCEP